MTETSAYDSRQDTTSHIHRVRELLAEVRSNLKERTESHDTSKLGPHEKPVFDEVTPKLKAMTYGSDEYKASLDEMGVALKHHYANNSHHPEHYPTGVNGMSLLDLIEMLCDWKAATERHADGSISRSFDINKTRFSIDGQLDSVLRNTARELGWTE